MKRFHVQTTSSVVLSQGWGCGSCETRGIARKSPPVRKPGARANSGEAIIVLARVIVWNSLREMRDFS